MVVDVLIWERYERAVRGLPVDRTADFEWMIESVDEFDLRMLLRTFDQREELLERIGRFEHDPSPQFTESEVVDLAQSLGAAYKSAALACGPENFPWAASSDPLGVRILPPETPGPTSNDIAGLFEYVLDAMRSELAAVTGARALMLVLEGRIRTVGLCYLLAPLVSTEFGFAADIALGKSGRAYWIENGQICVREPIPDPYAHLDDLSGWDPQHDWPTDDEIARRLSDLRQPDS